MLPIQVALTIAWRRAAGVVPDSAPPPRPEGRGGRGIAVAVAETVPSAEAGGRRVAHPAGGLGGLVRR